MNDEAKFKIGDLVTRFTGDKPGTVIDVVIVCHIDGQESFFYKVKFGCNVQFYVPCDLRLFTQETNDETDVSKN